MNTPEQTADRGCSAALAMLTAAHHHDWDTLRDLSTTLTKHEARSAATLLAVVCAPLVNDDWLHTAGATLAALQEGLTP